MESTKEKIIQIGICPNCNSPLYAKQVSIFGQDITYNIPCTCLNKNNKNANSNSTFNNFSPEYIKKHKQVMRYREWSNIGEKIKQSTFSNYLKTANNSNCFDYILSYCKNFQRYAKTGNSIFLYGNVGNGKTHLAIATMNYLNRLNYSVIFIKATRLITELDEAKDFSVKENITDIINLLSKADLLILDDLGANVWNKKNLDYLYKIIDARYDNNKPIFITSNIQPTYLKEIIGVRICDRLIGCSKFLDNKEDSFRRHEYAKKSKL